MKKIVIAGTHSGVGKTTITLGIMKALCQKGYKVRPFKVGPDYIDTAYHSFVTKVQSRNLDSYLLEEDVLKYLFEEAVKEDEVAVIEGVMGLYDGFGTDLLTASTAGMAKLLDAPVVLIVDGKGMAASAAAMVLGYQQLNTSLNLKGVIFNRVKTDNHYVLLKQAVERYTNVEVLGYIPPMEDITLPSRHLGLVPSVEIPALEEKINVLGEQISKCIQLEKLIEMAESKMPVTTYKEELPDFTGCSVAIAYDKAFNFYYEENLVLFRKLGISCKFFSPLKDKILPDAAAIYIGGGFPEVFAKELAENTRIKEAIYKAHQRNIPIYAECGGLMYLGETLEDRDGKLYPMVGIFKGKSKMTTSLKRFGYCEGIAKEDTILSDKGEKLRGHEFHHSVFETNEIASYKMQKVREGKVISTWEGGYSKGNTLATYMHIHFYSCIPAVVKFLNRGKQNGIYS